MNIGQCHGTAGEYSEGLKAAAMRFESTPREDVRSRTRAWAAVLFELRKLFQALEIMSHFNYHCTVDNLRAKGVLPHHEFPTSEQLCRNFVNGGGNVSFRKKWPFLRREVFSPLNRWGAAQRFSRLPDAFDCAMNYLETGGLERFWAAHPEFLKPEDPELIFEDELFDDENPLAA